MSLLERRMRLQELENEIERLNLEKRMIESEIKHKVNDIMYKATIDGLITKEQYASLLEIILGV